MTRADALELLHIWLGHMPYQQIKRMIRRQIIKGYKLDSKTLKALLGRGVMYAFKARR